MRYLQNGLVGYHIMDHLTRGPGTGAWVVWDPLLKRVGTDLPTEKQAAWMDRPAWIALAHELMHGWRLACGCCVFRPSAVGEYYYEEAMTVGLPPYDQCRFTENRFRPLKGLPLRTFYGEETGNQSTRAALKHGAAGSKLKFSINVVGSGPRRRPNLPSLAPLHRTRGAEAAQLSIGWLRSAATMDTASGRAAGIARVTTPVPAAISS